MGFTPKRGGIWAIFNTKHVTLLLQKYRGRILIVKPIFCSLIIFVVLFFCFSPILNRSSWFCSKRYKFLGFTVFKKF